MKIAKKPTPTPTPVPVAAKKVVKEVSKEVPAPAPTKKPLAKKVATPTPVEKEEVKKVAAPAPAPVEEKKVLKKQKVATPAPAPTPTKKEEVKSEEPKKVVSLKKPPKKEVAPPPPPPAEEEEEEAAFEFEDSVETDTGVYTAVKFEKDFHKKFAKDNIKGYPYRILAMENGELTEFLVVFVTKEWFHLIDVSSEGELNESHAIFAVDSVWNRLLEEDSTPVCLYHFAPKRK